MILDGMTVHRRHPFAHWICWILAQLSQNAHMDELEQSRTHFSFYSPTTPRDGRRGPRGQRRAQRILDERVLAEVRVVDDPTTAEDASLAAVEAQLPHYLVTDSEDSEDDEDFIPTVTVPRGAHDDEAGSSGAASPLLLQLPLLRSLRLIHSLLFFRGSLTSRTDLLQLT